MKLVEDLRDIHKNKEIWIVGTGPSLDNFPDDFFCEKKEDGKILEPEKITIALNWSILVFPKSTYWHACHPETVLWMKKNHPEVLKKSFTLLPMVPFRGHFRKKKLTEEISLNLLGEHKDDPVYLRWHWIVGNRPRFMELLPGTIKAIIAGKDCRYIALGTCIHYAIQIAVIIGSKKITLVGCELKADKDRIHARSRGLLEPYPTYTRKGFNMYVRRFGRLRLGIELLAKSFKPYGIEIQRYYYKSGYEAVT